MRDGLLADFGVLLVELLVLLFVISSTLALAVRRLGLGRIQRWLGGGRVRGTLKGMLVGFVVPFCTYSAIPTFFGMIDARVRTATSAGFLLAAPLLDPLVLAVLWLLFGWPITVAYTLVTATTVLLLALAADSLQVERHLRTTPRHAVVGAEGPLPEPAESAGCHGDPFTDTSSWQGLRDEAAAAATYALGLIRSLALPMVLAVAVAAGIVGYVPDELLARVAGPGNPLAVPTAALLGAPFYVSTEAFLPIASALHLGGMGLGAVLALTISAAGVNLPELALLSRAMTWPLLVAYTTAVVAIAITAGYLVPLLA